jgi:phenylalanyl-tRNA synthetase alpha chain
MNAEATPSIATRLEALRELMLPKIAVAATEIELREENAKVLGRKGDLTTILKDMGKVPAEERRQVGELVNALKAELEAAFERRLGELEKAALEAELKKTPYDLTLPGRTFAQGKLHPITQVRNEAVAIFRSLGFGVFDSREVELGANNFDRLGFPPDHPATDMQDSFWTKEGHVLRTHTSNTQVRAMMSQKPPMAFIAPGTVFRRDDDATHSPMFHQLEAFLIDENVSMNELKGVLAAFAERFFGANTPVRLRPSYFPFVEPGAEVDIGCVFCKQPDGTRAGCSVCKHTGWIEVLGCGMIHPVVFEACGIDPEQYTGFALGMGLERLAMLRFGVPNIKLFFENDPRFLAQF